MRVEGEQPESVVKNDGVTIDALVSREGNFPTVRRRYGGMRRRCEVYTQVHLTVDHLAGVKIGAVIGETGTVGRPRKPQKRPVPKDLLFRLPGNPVYRLGVLAPQFTVDFKKKIGLAAA